LNYVSLFVDLNDPLLYVPIQLIHVAMQHLLHPRPKITPKARVLGPE
jgi:hypothetical protein